MTELLIDAAVACVLLLSCGFLVWLLGRQHDRRFNLVLDRMMAYTEHGRDFLREERGANAPVSEFNPFELKPADIGPVVPTGRREPAIGGGDFADE